MIDVEIANADDVWPNPLSQDATYPALAAHSSEWFSSVAQGLQHRRYLLSAIAQGETLGILPLHEVNGFFGRFLVSLPYLNTGGIHAVNEEAAQALLNRACRLADDLDVRHLELRHEVPIIHNKLNFLRNDKVHMRLTLPHTADALMASFKSKLRSQVKKAMSNDLVTRFGSKDLLADFYDIFAHNMRDLGTPVYSRELFSSILETFGNNAELCVIYASGTAAAGGLLVHQKNVTEVPSASCLRSYNPLNINMYLYWSMLTRAIERNSAVFDFGRSSTGSGTYRFKEQWGAMPHQATWQYYVRKGDPASLRPDAAGKQRLVKLWQRIPVSITKLIGPAIVRGIP